MQEDKDKSTGTDLLKVQNTTDVDPNEVLLADVNARIPYTFIRECLVKPMPDEYVEKVIEEPTFTGVVDEKDGIPVSDVKEEVKKVKTDYKKGVLLKVPTGHKWIDTKGEIMHEDLVPKAGDIVVYLRPAARHFDLFRDTELVNPFNIVAFTKVEDNK